MERCINILNLIDTSLEMLSVDIFFAIKTKLKDNVIGIFVPI